MPTVIDSLIVTLGLDPKGFRKGADDAKAATESLKTSTAKGAQAAEQAGTRTGTAARKVGDEQKRQDADERKRQQQAEQARKRRAADEKKQTDQSIDQLKTLGLWAASAVLGFDSIKGAVAEYGNTVGQLANLGRFAPTVGASVGEVNKLGNALTQVGGKAEDAQADLQRLAHAQYSYSIHAPDAMAGYALRTGVSLFDTDKKTGALINRDKLEILKDIGAHIRAQTSDVQAQAQYARDMGLSEATIQLYVLKQADERDRILATAEASARATAENTQQAEKLSGAWNRVKNSIAGAKNEIVGGTMNGAATLLTRGADDFDKGNVFGGVVNTIDAAGSIPGNMMINAGSKLLDWFRKHTVYNPQFRDAEQKYGLPPGVLAAIARTESRDNPNAVSPNGGGKGLMQLNPRYHPNAGQSTAADIDDAARTMADLIRQNGGSLPLALAAYNAGQGTVNKALKGTKALPTETKNYVPDVLNGMAAANAATSAAAAATQTPAPGAGPASGSGGNTSVSIDTITINTKATDADGIASDIAPALERKGVVAQANQGMT